MLTPKGIAGFAARVLVLYVLLAAVPGEAVRDAYGRLFRAAGNGIFGTFGPRGVVRFRPLTESSEPMDTKMLIRVRPATRWHSNSCGSWYTG